MKANIQLRRSKERGHANHGWLDSYFSFSFADYYDPAHMQFRALRVINEDYVEPGKGFDMHPHRDMEIFTYVIEGELAHKDSMGHASSITSGQVQKITAGKGILHSEYNGSDKNPVHLLQIWIVPSEHGLKPSYEEYTLPKADDKDPLLLIGSPDGGDNVVHFHQDVLVYRGILKAEKNVSYPVKPGRGIWIQMVKGKINAGAAVLSEGDGVAIENVSGLEIKAEKDAEFLLFDLA